MNDRPYNNIMIKKKILFILPSTVGGAERMTLTISKMFTDDEAEIKYVIVHETLGDIVNFIPEKRAIIHIKTFSIWDVVTLRLVRIFKKEKPTHVFCSLRYLSIRVIIAAKLCGNIKIIIRCDNGLETILHSPKVLIPVIHTFPLADVIIAQQEEMQKNFKKVLGRKNPNVNVICIHNPLDTNMIDNLKSAPSPYTKKDEIRFVWTARFAKNKGQDILVRAFKLVLNKLTNAHLYLVGKYDENDMFYQNIKRYIAENKLDENVHIVGFDCNPYKWVINADCFVMPSRVEGLPNALIDAMYLEKPVAATTCIPMISRIVRDGVNGILAESENVESLSLAMINALDLKNPKMTYLPSKASEFKKLFV